MMLSGLGFANHWDGIIILLPLNCSLRYQISDYAQPLENDAAFLCNRSSPKLLDCHGRPNNVSAAAFRVEITPQQFRVL